MNVTFIFLLENLHGHLEGSLYLMYMCFFFFKSLNTFTELSRDSFDYCFTFVQTE